MDGWRLFLAHHALVPDGVMCNLWWASTVFNGMWTGDRGKAQHTIPPGKSRSCSVQRTTPGNQRGSQKQRGAGTGRQQQARSPPASYHSCCGRRDLLIHHQPAPTSQNRSGTTHTRQTGTQPPSSFGGSCLLLPAVANRLVL